MNEHEPLIVLTPLRGFSSVVCGLLGEHPDLYGFPELNLFNTDTVGELEYYCIQRSRHQVMHGLLRTLAQLHDGVQTEVTVHRARLWLREHSEMACKDLFNYLLDLVAPKIGIDKSPRTVMKIETMEQAYQMYPRAHFLHLTRHPIAAAKSIQEFLGAVGEVQDFVKGLQSKVGWDVEASIPAELDEGQARKRPGINPLKVWYQAHANIVSFTRTLPAGQVMRVRGEDILSELDLYLPQIAEWLGVRTDREAIQVMKHPENSPYACIGPSGARYGNDAKYLTQPHLRATKIQLTYLKDEIDWVLDATGARKILRLAREFGY